MSKVISGRWEFAILICILVVTILLRTVNLSSLPAGFHGDEAVVGLESQRILREGYVGPYSREAAGQPTGPLYLSAASVGLLGNTRLAVRIVPAIIGVITVLALYLLLRRSFGVAIALTSAGVLAVMSWHIHFARIGFPLEAWPLVVLAAAWTLSKALQNREWHWWAAAGAITGVGIYVYNAHPLYIGLAYLFILLYPLITERRRFRPDFAGIGLFSLGLVIAALPMLHYIAENTDTYLYHFERASLMNEPVWQELDSPVEKLNFVQDRYVEFWDRLSFNPELDAVDGTGTTAVVPMITLFLSAAGMAIALLRYRHLLVYLGAMLVILLPFGIIFTEGALVRRTFPMAVFLALFIGIGVIEAVRLTRRYGVVSQRLAAAGLIALLAISTYVNLDNYFDDFAQASTERHLLAKQFADASRFMSRMPDSYYIYFYSSKWSINYQPRQFLAPKVNGEDRSDRFGQPGHAISWLRGRPLFIFLDDYRSHLDLVHKLYPGGNTMIAGPDDDPAFIAYEPPPP